MTTTPARLEEIKEASATFVNAYVDSWGRHRQDIPTVVFRIITDDDWQKELERSRNKTNSILEKIKVLREKENKP